MADEHKYTKEEETIIAKMLETYVARKQEQIENAARNLQNAKARLHEKEKELARAKEIVIQQYEKNKARIRSAARILGSLKINVPTGNLGVESEG